MTRSLSRLFLCMRSREYYHERVCINFYHVHFWITFYHDAFVINMPYPRTYYFCERCTICYQEHIQNNRVLSRLCPYKVNFITAIVHINDNFLDKSRQDGQSPVWLCGVGSDTNLLALFLATTIPVNELLQFISIFKTISCNNQCTTKIHSVTQKHFSSPQRGIVSWARWHGLFDSFRESVCDCLSLIYRKFHQYSKNRIYQRHRAIYWWIMLQCGIFTRIFAIFIPETTLAHDFASS